MKLVHVSHPLDHRPEFRLWVQRLEERMGRIIQHPKYKKMVEDYMVKSLFLSQPVEVDHDEWHRVIEEIIKEAGLHDA